MACPHPRAPDASKKVVTLCDKEAPTPQALRFGVIGAKGVLATPIAHPERKDKRVYGTDDNFCL